MRGFRRAAEPMFWTKDIPKAAGWYWCKLSAGPAGEYIAVVLVRCTMREDWRVIHDGEDTCLLSEKFRMWGSEPIPGPYESQAAAEGKPA